MMDISSVGGARDFSLSSSLGMKTEKKDSNEMKKNQYDLTNNINKRLPRYLYVSVSLSISLSMTLFSYLHKSQFYGPMNERKDSCRELSSNAVVAAFKQQRSIGRKLPPSSCGHLSISLYLSSSREFRERRE